MNGNPYWYKTYMSMLKAVELRPGSRPRPNAGLGMLSRHEHSQMGQAPDAWV